jgi:pyruvate dehydrogenase E1 component beta subunit
MKYIDEIQKGMDLLSTDPNVKFVGQAVAYKGTGITNQVKNYPEHKKIELPVAEDFQAGFCLGLALDGFLPVCIYPRANFAILAANQIVNHLDKWWKMCDGESKPKMIIKVAVGSQYPLDPGHQHKANYAQAFRDMCEHVKVVDLLYPNQIFSEYKKAYEREESTILFEHADLYGLTI